MTQNKSENIKEGLLYKALRASVSLPGIVPPVSNAQGDLYIDGSVLNNLPVDVMRNITGAGKVIAARVITPNLKLSAQIPEGYMSGWKVLLMRYFQKKSNTRIPNIAEIISAAIMLAGNQHEQLMSLQADCCLQINTEDFQFFDFKKIDKLIEIGYSTTMNKLSNEPHLFI